MMHLIIALLITILPPCQYEDSDLCYWNASEQGNDTGTSFISIGGRVLTLS